MAYPRRALQSIALVFVALVASCSGSQSGEDATLQCDCVRASFVDGFLDRTLPDGTACDNSAIGGCPCLASRCQNFCAFDICQPPCESNEECPEDFECNELVDPEFGSLGQFCEFVEPCPEGTAGCPCGPNDECNAFGDRLEAFCDADGICQVSDLCQAGCRQGSVCCGGALCSGDCIGTPCC